MRSSAALFVVAVAAVAQAQELPRAATSPVALPQIKASPRPRRARVAPVRIDREAEETARQARIAKNERLMSTKRRSMIATINEILAQAGPRYAQRYDRLFQRAELEWEEAKYQHYVARQRYDERLAALAPGAAAPPEPRPDFGHAIATYRVIIKEHPRFQRINEVRYHLGYALLQAGDASEAARVLRTLVDKAPRSRLAAPALRLMGDLWFDRHKFVAAQQLYQDLITRFPGSRDADYAQYKLAWCLHNRQQYGVALEAFKRLVTTRKGRRPSELREQALGDMLATYASMPGGWQPARQYFQQVLGTAGMRRQLTRLAMALDAQDRNREALELLDWLVRQDPRGAQVPRHHRLAINMLKRLGQPERYRAELGRIISFYDRAGAWYRANQGHREVIARGDEIVLESLLFVATYHHALAQRGGGASRYQAAARSYEALLQRFPQHPQSPLAAYRLGEVHLALGAYEQAATRYEEAATRGRGELRSDAAYKTLFCYAAAIKRQGSAAAGAGPGKDEARPRTPLTALERRFVAAADKLVGTLVKGERELLVRLRVGTLFWHRGQFAEAARRSQLLLTRQPRHRHAAAAGALILDSYNRTGDWPQVTKWARYLLKVKNFQAQSRRELREIVARSAVKAARILEARKDYRGAAEAMMAVVEEFPRAPTAVAAMFNAAVLHEKAGQREAAVKLYRRVRQRWPRHAFAARATLVLAQMAEARADFNEAVREYERAVGQARTEQTADALYRAGVVRLLLGQERRAAAHFRRYAELFPDRPDAWNVFLQAGAALEQGGARDEAAALYQDYLRRAPGAAQQRGVEALTRAAVARQSADPDESRKLLTQAVALFAKARLAPGSPMAPHAARAQFLLGEARLKELQHVRLVLPERELQRGIATKARLMKSAIDLYLRVARFKAPAWTAAATFRVGWCYEHFARALVEAPVPRDLSEEQREVYRARLQEQAQPIEDQAQRAFAAAVQFARRAHFYSQWTARAATHLARYRPTEHPVAGVPLEVGTPHQRCLETGGVRP